MTAPDLVSRAEIPAPVLERVRARALDAYPEECCGLLVGWRESDHVRVDVDLPVDNVAPKHERTRTFRIDPKTLLDAMRERREGGDEVVGFYHSHPDHPAELSPTDLTFAALWPRTLWVIVPVAETDAGAERAWWLPAKGAESDPRELPIHPPAPAGRTPTKSGGVWT